MPEHYLPWVCFPCGGVRKTCKTCTRVPRDCECVGRDRKILSCAACGGTGVAAAYRAKVTSPKST